MEAKLIEKDELLKNYNRHYISEENIRVQVVEITGNNKVSNKFYDKHKGELLIISLKGFGKVITPESEIAFDEHDQVFVNTATPFRIESSDRTIVELIWTPGLYKKNK